MKIPIRSFSLGLLTAGIILIVSFYIFDTSEKKAEEIPVDEMITIMKDEGYRVVTESEYITLSVNKDAENEESKQDDDVNEKDSSEEEKVASGKNEKETNNENESETQEESKEEKKEAVVTYELNIEAGMPSSAIGELLEENNVIQNGAELNKYLDDEGYSLRVQQGTFTVKSDMSFNEIAEEITR